MYAYNLLKQHTHTQSYILVESVACAVCRRISANINRTHRHMYATLIDTNCVVSHAPVATQI